MNRAERRKLASGRGLKQTPRGTRRTIDFTPVARVLADRRQPQPYTVLVLRPDHMATNYGQDTFLAHVEATSPAQAQRIARQEEQQLTPLQAQVAANYQGGEFAYIETQRDAQIVGDGLFTFCVNEAGDAGDKPELIDMLNRAIDQLRSLVGELETAP